MRRYPRGEMHGPWTISTPVTIIAAYTAAIALSEIILVNLSVILGTVCHSLLLFALLWHFGVAEHVPSRRMLLPLALLPLLRILSLTMPVQDAPQIYWHALAGLPLLLAAGLAAHALEMSWAELGLGRAPWWKQAVIALTGIPLGFVSFWLLDPPPLSTSLEWPEAAVGSLILLVCVGLPEELIFRGLIQRTAGDLFPRAAFVYSSLLFAIMITGSLLWEYVVFAGLVGLFFGGCVRRTGSLWGVILAHSAISIETIVLLPFLLT
ncbi:MAG: CPBP family intramembrane metalloprotease [Chloroflexi bacterium]|nr:CPBP family intramembrane metalloprotease [Chloroflexota bacterium]